MQEEQQGTGLDDGSEEFAAALPPQDLARSHSQGRHPPTCQSGLPNTSSNSYWKAKYLQSIQITGWFEKYFLH